MKIINPYRFGGADSLLTGLVAWWPMDETSGTRADAHNSYDLTDNNTVGSTTGLIGNAADFVAANSESLTSEDDVFATPAAFTFALWTKLDASFERIAGVYISSNRKIFFESAAGTVIKAVFHSNQTLNSTVARTGGWQLLVAWADGAGNIYFSVDNETPVTAATGTDMLLDTQTLYFGATNGNYGTLPIDNAAFWSRVLTASERTRLYNSGSGMAYPG